MTDEGVEGREVGLVAEVNGTKDVIGLVDRVDARSFCTIVVASRACWTRERWVCNWIEKAARWFSILVRSKAMSSPSSLGDGEGRGVGVRAETGESVQRSKFASEPRGETGGDRGEALSKSTAPSLGLLCFVGESVMSRRGSCERLDVVRGHRPERLEIGPTPTQRLGETPCWAFSASFCRSYF